MAKRLTKVGELKVDKGRNNLRGDEGESRKLTGRDKRVVIDLVNVKIRIIDREKEN